MAEIRRHFVDTNVLLDMLVPGRWALDWSQCPAVETIPGKVSGAWVFQAASEDSD